MRVLLLLCLIGVALASPLTKKGKTKKKSQPESILQKTEETLSDVGKADNLEDEIERYNNLLTLMKKWRERLELRTGRQITDFEKQTRIKNGRKKNIGGKKTKKSQKKKAKKAKKKKQKKELLKNKTQREMLTPNKTNTTNGKGKKDPDALSQISDRNNNLSKSQNLTIDKQKPQESNGRGAEVSTNTKTNDKANTVLIDEPLDKKRESKDKVMSKSKHNDIDDEEAEISQDDTPGERELSENSDTTDTEPFKSEETDISRNDIEEHIDNNKTNGRKIDVAEEDSNTNELKQIKKIDTEDDVVLDIISEPKDLTSDAVNKDIEDIPQPDKEESPDKEPQQSGEKEKETSNLQRPETGKGVANEKQIVSSGNEIHGEKDENTKSESDIITESGHKEESGRFKEESDSKGRDQTSETDTDENEESAGTGESGNPFPADNDSETKDIPIQGEGKFSGKIKSGGVAGEGSSVERPNTENKEEEAQNKQIIPLENEIPQENVLFEDTAEIDTDLSNVKETDDNNDDKVEENDDGVTSDEETGNVEESSEGVTSENEADKSGEANGKKESKHSIPEATDVEADDVVQPSAEESSNGAPVKGDDVAKDNDIQAEDFDENLVAKQEEKDREIAEKSDEHPTGTDIDKVMNELITDQDLIEAPNNDASLLGSKGNTKVNDKRKGARSEGKGHQKHSAEEIEERGIGKKGSDAERPNTGNKEEAEIKQIVPLENKIPPENLLFEDTAEIDTDLSNVKETDDNNDDIVEENDDGVTIDEETGNVKESSEGVTSENDADKSGEANGKKASKYLIPEAMDVEANDVVQPDEEELSNGAPVKGDDEAKDNDMKAEDFDKNLVTKQEEKDREIAEESDEHPTGTDIDKVMNELITDQDLIEIPANDASLLGSKGNTQVNDQRKGIRNEGKEHQKHSAEEMEERDIGKKAHERTDRTGNARYYIQNDLDLSNPIHIRERQGDLDIETTNQEDDDGLNSEKRVKELRNIDKNVEEGRTQGQKSSNVKENLLNSKDSFELEKKITDWIEKTSSKRPANVSYGSAVYINKRLDDFLEYLEEQSGDSEIDMTKLKRYIYELTQYIGVLDISKFKEIVHYLRENPYRISTSRLKQIIENLKIASNNTKKKEESPFEKFRERKEEIKKKMSQIREKVNGVNETQESTPGKELRNLDEKESGGRALDEKPRYVKETTLKRKDRYDFDEKLAGWIEKKNSSERPGNASYDPAMYINKKLDDFIEYLEEQSEDSEIDMAKLKKYIYELAQHTGLLDTSKFKHMFRYISEYPRNFSITRLKQTLESLKITSDNNKTNNESVLEKIKEKKEEIKKRINQIRENIKPININVFPSNATNITTKNASLRFPLEIPSELRTRNGTYADIIRKDRNGTRNTTTENRNNENRSRIEIYHYSFKPRLSSNRTKPGNKTLPESNKYNQLGNDYIRFGRRNTTENNATSSNSSSYGRSNRVVQAPILRNGPTRIHANVSLPKRLPPLTKDITQANTSFPSQLPTFNASLPKQVPTLRNDITYVRTNASSPQQVPSLGNGSTRGHANTSLPQQVPTLRKGSGRGRANPYLPKQVPTLRKNITDVNTNASSPRQVPSLGNGSTRGHANASLPQQVPTLRKGSGRDPANPYLPKQVPTLSKNITSDQTNASFPQQLPTLGKGSTRDQANASLPQQVPTLRKGTAPDGANPYLPKQVSILSIDATRNQVNASLPNNVRTSGRGNTQEGANTSLSKQVPASKTDTSRDKVNSSLPKHVSTSGKGTSKVQANGLNRARPPVKTTQTIKKEARPAVSETPKKTGDITKVRRPIKSNVNSQTTQTADKPKTTGNVPACNDGKEKAKPVGKTKNTLESKPTLVKTSSVKQTPTNTLGKGTNGKTATKYSGGNLNQASVATKQAIGSAGSVQVKKNVIPSRQNPAVRTKSRTITNGRARVNRPSVRNGRLF